MGKLIPNAFNLAVVIYVALGSTACSYGMAIIGYVTHPSVLSLLTSYSSTIGQPSFYASLGLAPQGEPGYSRTAQYIGAFNGVNSAGSAIGAALCSYFADKYSRKRTIQFAACILIVGAAICAGSINNAMFLVGRVINGLGIGALVTVSFQSEYYRMSFANALTIRQSQCIKLKYQHLKAAASWFPCMVSCSQWATPCPPGLALASTSSPPLAQPLPSLGASQSHSKWSQHCCFSLGHPGCRSALDG